MKNINDSSTSCVAVAIIQARMNSTRLPGKALLDLGGKPLLYHVIERARAIKGVTTVVLATAHGDENRPLADLAAQCGIELFIGSLDNVLERYYLASEEFPCTHIIRITGDNPFTDPKYASTALSKAIETGADLCSLSGLPLGTAVEIIKKEALDRAYKESFLPYHFEHVTPYIKEHENIFKIIYHESGLANPFSDLRLTVDTDDDYLLAKTLYNNLYHGEPFALKKVISYICEHNALARINNMVQQRPMTHSSGKHKS